MSTVVEGKDTVKFVNEEQIEQAAVDAVETKNENTAEDEPSSAFNPETGEINWDCPCLGGMAQGPCGEQFKAAFSCFVFSEAEPKGLDCVDKFKGMQDCFRLHPDVYGDEIDDDDDDEEPIKELTTEESITTEESTTTEEPTVTEESTTTEEPTAASANEESSFSSWVSSWF